MISDHQLVTLFGHLQPLLSQGNPHAALTCVLRIEAILAFPHAPLSLYLPQRLLIAPKTSRTAFDLTDLPSNEVIPPASAPDCAEDLLSDSDRLAVADYLASLLLGSGTPVIGLAPSPHSRSAIGTSLGGAARNASVVAVAALTVLLHAPLGTADPARLAACTALRRLVRDGSLRRSAARHAVVAVLLRMLATPAAADVKVEAVPVVPRGDVAVAGGMFARPQGAVRTVVTTRPSTAMPMGVAARGSLGGGASSGPGLGGASAGSGCHSGLPGGAPVCEDGNGWCGAQPSVEELLLAAETLGLLLEDTSLAAAAARRQAAAVLACAIGTATAYPSAARVGRRRGASRVSNSQNELVRLELIALARVCGAVTSGSTIGPADGNRVPPLVSVVALASDLSDLTSYNGSTAADDMVSGGGWSEVSRPATRPGGSAGSRRCGSPPYTAVGVTAPAFPMDAPARGHDLSSGGTSSNPNVGAGLNGTGYGSVVGGVGQLSRLATSPNMIQARATPTSASNASRRHSNSFSFGAAAAATNTPTSAGPAICVGSSVATPVVLSQSLSEPAGRRRLPPMAAARLPDGPGSRAAALPVGNSPVGSVTSTSVAPVPAAMPGFGAQISGNNSNQSLPRAVCNNAHNTTPSPGSVGAPVYTSFTGNSSSGAATSSPTQAVSEDPRVILLAAVTPPPYGLVRAGVVDAVSKFFSVTVPAEVLTDAADVTSQFSSSPACAADLARRLGPRGLVDVVSAYVSLAAGVSPRQLVVSPDAVDERPSAPCPAAVPSALHAGTVFGATNSNISGGIVVVPSTSSALSSSSSLSGTPVPRATAVPTPALKAALRLMFVTSQLAALNPAVAAHLLGISSPTTSDNLSSLVTSAREVANNFLSLPPNIFSRPPTPVLSVSNARPSTGRPMTAHGAQPSLLPLPFPLSPSGVSPRAPPSAATSPAYPSYPANQGGSQSLASLGPAPSINSVTAFDDGTSPSVALAATLDLLAFLSSADLLVDARKSASEALTCSLGSLFDLTHNVLLCVESDNSAGMGITRPSTAATGAGGATLSSATCAGAGTRLSQDSFSYSNSNAVPHPHGAAVGVTLSSGVSRLLHACATAAEAVAASASLDGASSVGLSSKAHDGLVTTTLTHDDSACPPRVSVGARSSSDSGGGYAPHRALELATLAMMLLCDAPLLNIHDLAAFVRCVCAAARLLIFAVTSFSAAAATTTVAAADSPSLRASGDTSGLAVVCAFYERALLCTTLVCERVARCIYVCVGALAQPLGAGVLESVHGMPLTDSALSSSARLRLPPLPVAASSTGGALSPPNDTLAVDPSPTLPPRPVADPVTALTLVAISAVLVLARCGRITGTDDDSALLHSSRPRGSDGFTSMNGRLVESADGSDNDADGANGDIDTARPSTPPSVDLAVDSLRGTYPAAALIPTALARSMAATGGVTFRDVVPAACAVEFGSMCLPDAFAPLLLKSALGNVCMRDGLANSYRPRSTIDAADVTPSTSPVDGYVPARLVRRLMLALSGVARSAEAIAAHVFAPQTAAAVATAMAIMLDNVTLSTDSRGALAAAVSAASLLVTPSSRPTSALP